MPWFRGLFIGSPDVQPITHAPFIYQLHVTAAWMIWGLWPFSRLVHAWSYPLWYPWRPYIVYRSRPARSALRAGYRRAQVAQDRYPVLSPLGLPRLWVASTAHTVLLVAARVPPGAS